MNTAYHPPAVLKNSLPLNRSMFLKEAHNRSSWWVIYKEGWKERWERKLKWELRLSLTILPQTERTAFGIKYSGPPTSVGDMFQDPQWMPETVNSTEPYIYYIFSYTYIPMIKFNS